MGGKGSGRKLQPCGTSAAYQRHRKKGENCIICKSAEAKNKRERYKPNPKSRAVTRVQGRKMIIEEKLRRGACMDCQLVVTRENYFVFDFDHRDPQKKSFAISSKARDVAFQTLRDEFDKCDLVCANCHRFRTQKQFKNGVLTGLPKDIDKVEVLPTLFDLTG
jgi:hypothetical protein